MTADTDDSFFNENDFKSVKHLFQITNTTTNTKTSNNAEIHLAQLTERGMILEIPTRTCAQGHHLSIDLTTEFPGKKPIKFTFTAKVASLEKMNESIDQVTLDLQQFVESEWLNYCEIFSERQREVEEFFKSVKGF